MRRQCKLMPKTGVHYPIFDELAYNLQGIHRLLCGLRGESIHQIGMDQNTRLRKMISDLSNLRHLNPFVN